MNRLSFAFVFMFVFMTVFTINATAQAQLIGPDRNGQYYCITDTTIDTTVNGGVCIGFANQDDLDQHVHGISPTVNVISPAIDPGDTIRNNSTLNITGGNIGSLGFFDRSTGNVSGGTFSGQLALRGDSTFNIFGGNIIGGDLDIEEHGTGNVSGGSIDSGITHSVVHVNGADTTFNLYGGKTHCPIIVQSGTVNLFGTNLEAESTTTDPYNVNFGDNVDIFLLSGTLQDGTSLDGVALYLWKDCRDGCSRYTLNSVPVTAVPEVSGALSLSVLLFTTGGLVLNAGRGRRINKS